jgi:hypothetical protein
MFERLLAIYDKKHNSVIGAKKQHILNGCCADMIEYKKTTDYIAAMSKSREMLIEAIKELVES